MKDIFMSPILYTVIGVLLNTIIIYVKNYKEAKAMQGTGTFKYNWKAFSVNAKFPPSVQNVVNLILLIATIVTYVMGGSKINDAIAVILIYVIVNIIRPIVGGIIFSKIALKKTIKGEKYIFSFFVFL
ncbi:MAG: hypothetical protein ACLRYC_04450 [Clostridia bacterium]